MMRIVPDTNVIVSAILSPRSNSARIIRLVFDGMLNLVISHDIIDETCRVVRYPKLIKLMKMNGLTPRDVDSVIDKLSKIAIVTPGELTLDVYRNDPSGNKIVAYAVEGEANFIISGDRHLTDLREYQGIMIVNPATLLTIIEHEPPQEY